MGSASVEPTNSESFFLSQDEVEEFDSTYEEIIRTILELTDEMMPDMKIIADRLVKLLKYNVLGGKKIRYVPSSVRQTFMKIKRILISF